MTRLLLLLALLPGVARAQSARGQILQAWRQRQVAIDSAQFVWAEQQAHRRDWLPNPRHPEPERTGDPALVVERMDSVFRTLVISGPRMRYSYVARRMTPDGRRPVFDTVRLDWRPPSTVPQELWLRPVLMAVRPLDPHLGTTGLGRGRVNPWYDPMYRGPPVLNFEEPAGRDGWKWSFWVDPARDYVIKRYRLMKGDTSMIEVSIDYMNDERWGHLPCRWVINRRKFPQRSLWRSDSAELRAFRVNGIPGVIPGPDAPRESACR